METYWGLHAERIGFREFWTFLWRHRADTLRYVRWAEEQALATGRPLPDGRGSD